MAHSRKGKNGTKNLKIAFFINVARRERVLNLTPQYAQYQ